MDGSDTSTWAPQSPDLSSYYLGGDHPPPEEPIHPQHQRYRGSISHSLPYSPPTSSPTLQTKPPFFPMPRGVKKEASRDDGDYMDASEMPAVKGKKPKDIVGTEGGNTTLPGTEHIKITSHFPVARIKRIMQADDDVGKVAQVTPVVVSKALELFMISLVTQAATEAKSNGSKRVSTAHLKQAITKNEQFDFLSDIVAKIADAPSSADKDNGDAMEVDGKKRKAAGRKKKKTDDDNF